MTDIGSKHYTQGEYVAYFGRQHIGMDLSTALVIRDTAIKIAKESEISPGSKSGSKISAGRKTPTLPKEIWAKAYETLT